MLDYYLLSVQNPQVQHHLDEVSGSLTALKQTVGVTVLWDRREMVQRASALESLAQGIYQTIQAWHRTARIQDNVHLVQAQELIDHCHELEQLIDQRSSMLQIREECDHVIEAWQHLRPHLRECQTAERDSLERLAGGFTPELVRIRTVLPE